MAKSTNVEIDIRINEVSSLFLDGWSRGEIIQHCSEKWKVSERQVDTYLARVYEQVSEDIGKYRKSLIKQSVKRFNDLYEKNEVKTNYQECRLVQESIIKLFGLNEPIKSEVRTEGEVNIIIE